MLCDKKITGVGVGVFTDTVSVCLPTPTVQRCEIGRWSGRDKRVGKYEGWNFNSGNYLFTTDTK